MKRAYIIASILVVSIVLLSLVVIYVFPVGKQVSGNISSDTTWAGTIDVEANVTVTNGAKLTIQPGTTVNLGYSTIQIDGTLVAKGNAIQKIVLNGGRIIFTANSTPWNEQAGSGSIIENCQATTGFLIRDASPKVSASVLNRPIPHDLTEDILVIYGGAPTVSNNIFDGNVVRASRFEGGGSGISLVTATNATISGNTIQNCIIGIDAYSGKYQTNLQPIGPIQSNLTIEDNFIHNNGQGVYFGAPTRTVCENNSLTENSAAIWVTGFSNQSVVSGNNIYGNSNSSITLMGSPTNMDIPNNWWGTTDTDKIVQSIYDSRTNPLLGTVNFTPILEAPNPAAPKA
jgi:parallel beta-helix repeat protein